MDNDMKKQGIALIPMESQKLEKLLEKFREPLNAYFDGKSKEIDGELRRVLARCQDIILEYGEDEQIGTFEEIIVKNPDFADGYRTTIRQVAEIKILSDIIFSVLTKNLKSKNLVDIVKDVLANFNLLSCMSEICHSIELVLKTLIKEDSGAENVIRVLVMRLEDAEGEDAEEIL